MKKALSFAVALGLVAGMASYAAAATVDFHGDARLRGVTFNTTTFDEADPEGIDAFDQRYRLVANVTATEDLMVGFRLNMLDGTFGNNRTNDAVNCTVEELDTTGDGIPDTITLDKNGNPVSNCSQDGIMVDRAYMKAKMLGGTWLLGRQNASWGNKFLGWGNGVDRIKGIYKSGDLTYGGYLQKNREAANNDDYDTYGGFIIGKSGDSKWGALPNYVVDHSAKAAAAGKETGMLLDVFFNTKIGAVNLMTEFVFKGGDIYESSDGDAALGGFVGATTSMDALTVKGLIAFYQNNEGELGGTRDCDNDFAPTVLVGTCQETALIDFGSTTLSGIGNADDSTYMLTVGADLKVNDELTVGAAIAYIDLSKNDDAQLTEVDLTASYVLAKGVTYKASFAYGDLTVGGTTFDPEELIVFGNNISVKW